MDSNQTAVSLQGYAPKRFALQYNPPMIILEYFIPSKNKLYHHRMRLKDLKKESVIADLVQYLRQRHSIYLDHPKITNQQLEKLVTRLKEGLDSNIYQSSDNFSITQSNDIVNLRMPVEKFVQSPTSNQQIQLQQSLKEPVKLSAERYKSYEEEQLEQQMDMQYLSMEDKKQVGKNKFGGKKQNERSNSEQLVLQKQQNQLMKMQEENKEKLNSKATKVEKQNEEQTKKENSNISSLKTANQKEEKKDQLLNKNASTSPTKQDKKTSNFKKEELEYNSNEYLYSDEFDNTEVEKYQQMMFQDKKQQEVKTQIQKENEGIKKQNNQEKQIFQGKEGKETTKEINQNQKNKQKINRDYQIEEDEEQEEKNKIHNKQKLESEQNESEEEDFDDEQYQLYQQYMNAHQAELRKMQQGEGEEESYNEEEPDGEELNEEELALYQQHIARLQKEQQDSDGEEDENFDEEEIMKYQQQILALRKQQKGEEDSQEENNEESEEEQSDQEQQFMSQLSPEMLAKYKAELQLQYNQEGSENEEDLYDSNEIDAGQYYGESEEEDNDI